MVFHAMNGKRDLKMEKKAFDFKIFKCNYLGVSLSKLHKYDIIPDKCIEATFDIILPELSSNPLKIDYEKIE